MAAYLYFICSEICELADLKKKSLADRQKLNG